MILSDSEIKKYQKKGILHIEDFNEDQLNPNSYNLKLMNKLLVYDEVVLDMKKENKTREIIIPEEGLILEPGRLYIGSTTEYTETHAPLLGIVNGRSSIGRLGIFIHVTAGFIDTGFCGNITLEIFCIHPVRVYPNVEICQLVLELVEGEVENPYCGKYQGQTLPTASRMNVDLEKKESFLNADDIITKHILDNMDLDLEVGKYARAVPTQVKIDPDAMNKNQVKFPLKSSIKNQVEYCNMIADSTSFSSEEHKQTFKREMIKQLNPKLTEEKIKSSRIELKELVISLMYDIISKTVNEKMANKDALIQERVLRIASTIIDYKYQEIYDSIRFKNNLDIEFMFNINFYGEVADILSDLEKDVKKYVQFKNDLASRILDHKFHIKIITETLNNSIRKDEK